MSLEEFVPASSKGQDCCEAFPDHAPARSGPFFVVQAQQDYELSLGVPAPLVSGLTLPRP